MTKQKVVSVFLVLLVSVLCPAACGLRAAAAGERAPATDCCGRRVPPTDGPHGPVLPNNPSPDSCFCTTQGVTIEKGNAYHLPVLPLPFLSDAQGDDPPNTLFGAGTLQSFRFHPPDQQRILPLLI